MFAAFVTIEAHTRAVLPAENIPTDGVMSNSNTYADLPPLNNLHWARSTRGLVEMALATGINPVRGVCRMARDVPRPSTLPTPPSYRCPSPVSS